MCFNCGGFGHLKANCPSLLKINDAKGGGKAGDGKGGYGKGGYGKGCGFGGGTSGGKGFGKSGGQGIKGECWNCGKAGHRSADCRSPKVVNNIDEAILTYMMQTMVLMTVFNVKCVCVMMSMIITAP